MSEVILVEGVGDVDFISGFVQKIGKQQITSYPPRPIGGAGNGINNVITTIQLLINKILDGTITKAAVVVDADYTGINGGFNVRRAEIAAKLTAAGYTVPPVKTTGSPPGEIFTHPSGQAPIGLYIFPNHNDDGMLEDLLKQMVVAPPYSALLQHAMNVVAAPPAKLFNVNLHTAKAEIGTFLAWQVKPPAYVGNCVSNNIFDAGSPAADDFRNWINTVF